MNRSGPGVRSEVSGLKSSFSVPGSDAVTSERQGHRMPAITESAASCWEVHRRANYHTRLPYCAVILRNKKAQKSVVKATSTDFQSMNEYAEMVQSDLHELSNQEFVNKYRLSTSS